MEYFLIFFYFDTAKDKIEKNIRKRQKNYVENKMFVLAFNDFCTNHHIFCSLLMFERCFISWYLSCFFSLCVYLLWFAVALSKNSAQTDWLFTALINEPQRLSLCSIESFSIYLTLRMGSGLEVCALNQKDLYCIFILLVIGFMHSSLHRGHDTLFDVTISISIQAHLPMNMNKQTASYEHFHLF